MAFNWFGSPLETQASVACLSPVHAAQVLCWAPGQGSRIHNHGDSHGWVTVVRGRVRGFRRDGKRGQPRWNPEFGDADFELLWNSEGNPEPLPRYFKEFSPT